MATSKAATPTRVLTTPLRAEPPHLAHSAIASKYRSARVGGDFYDYMTAGPERMAFMLLDIAGKRDEALDVAAQVQGLFRARVPELFGGEDLNEAEATTDLLVSINKKIIEVSGGVRCAAAFIGVYDDNLGTMFYINAGHTPALLRDPEGITQLPAQGPPLGLFSHTTNDALMSVLRPGSALLLISKGLVEARVGSKDYGLERAEKALAKAKVDDPATVCESVLNDVAEFLTNSTGAFRLPFTRRDSADNPYNDHTVLALVRR
ncbi:MAG TPA: PP2C family serine/threonine-protein phosphatase [Terriglobales bacterium]|jgi:sigma-B regulation protein RsbU (phosphoserine phosphatase)|nr:PP2C family serine/threonine-protein phosphatase [Terriglobales bacterium]